MHILMSNYWYMLEKLGLGRKGITLALKGEKHLS
jgi:hypothetical protein